ncbi:MAG: M56 family metallopeptidase [Eubacteriales bacterium]
MYEKAVHDMWKSANPSHFNPEAYIPNHYQVMTVLSYIWLVVMGILTVKGLYSYQKSHQHLKKHLEPMSNPEVLEEYRLCSEKMGKKNPPELFTHPYINTPMLTGFFEPKIFLPSNFSRDNVVLSAVFLHELSHYKGKDLWLQCFGEVAKIIHWFNPLIYVLLNTQSFWCEVLCDQVVVEDFDKNQRINYAQSILSSGKKEELELLSVAKLSEGTWKPLTMKNRLAMICQEQHHKKSKWKGFLSRILLVAFCAILLCFCFKIGEKAPIVDSVFPYVEEIYPRIVIYYPDF